MDPMPKRPTRRLLKTGAEAIARPTTGVPLGIVLDAVVAARHVVGQAAHPLVHRLDEHLRLYGAGGDAAEGGEQRCRPDAESRQSFVDQLLDPGGTSGGVSNKHTG